MKYILIALVILSVVALVGCVSRTNVVGENKNYEITSDVKSLDIRISAADFVIVQGDGFSVESNLKNLSVSEEDGVLRIFEKTRFARNYNGASLKLCIPESVVFENVFVKTGAGKLTAQPLSANTMKLKTGAGQTEFECLNVESNIEIKGGAGEINIKDGTLNNLSVNLGVGELNMNAKLIGESKLKFGVGESNITLLGNREDYRFDIKNGVGTINIDGVTVSGIVGSGIGVNTVKIKGGVGNTNIRFSE